MTFDLFETLRWIDARSPRLEAAARDPEWMREARKALQYVLPQWLSTAGSNAGSAKRLLAFEQLNPIWSPLVRDNPVLALRLLSRVFPKGAEHHKFIVPRHRKSLLLELLTMFHPDIREEEVALWITCSSKQDLEELMDRAGYQSDQRKPLREEFKKRS